MTSVQVVKVVENEVHVLNRQWMLGMMDVTGSYHVVLHTTDLSTQRSTALPKNVGGLLELQTARIQD